MNRLAAIRHGTIALMAMAAGATPALAKDAPGDDFDVIGYALSLIPDMSSATISGRETITLRIVGDDVRRLRFSGNALIIDRAMLDGSPIRHSQTPDTLTFDLPHASRRGRIVRLALSYHGRPARGLVTSATSLYTSYFACDWMICRQDQFGDKAALSLDLRVPGGMDALAVGGRIAVRPGPGGSEIQSWKTPRPYSPYLYGFAIGRFARAGDRSGSAKLAYLSDSADAATLKRIFAATPDIVRFFSDKAGVALPVAEYTQLLVAGDEAQEAATYSVLGVEALPERADDPAQDWAIAHELAHQWWGNLVTCATLTDFWLNEGITTFMTAAWKEHRYGRAAYDAELEVARTRLARARTMGFDKPLAWGGRYPSLGTRRAVQYGKGALFLDSLRSELGDAAFWAGLRRYTRDHADGTVTSIDLQRAMEAASHRDLRPLFEQWVFDDAEAAAPVTPG